MLPVGYPLEPLPQVFELLHHQQAPLPWPQILFLQHPGMRVRHEHRVQPRFQRRIHVRFRAVADHPRDRRVHPALHHQAPVRRRIFLFHDRRVLEEPTQAGAVDLQLLFVHMPLGEEREIVPSRQVAERFRDPRNHLHGAFQNALGEAHHRPQIFRAYFPFHQVLVTLPQIAAEIQRAVPVDLGVGPFHLVQNVADLLRRHRRMIQERHKLLERALEVDIVLPERVVGIDHEVLAGHCLGRGARWKGISKMASTSTATPSRSAGVNSHFANASRALRSSRASSWRSNAIPPTCPSFPITANSRTVPSTRSSTAAAMYLGSTFRTTPGGRICRGAAPAVPVASGSRSANHTSQLPEKLVTLGIWLAMAYTTLPANRGSGASATRGARGSTGTFGAAAIDMRAAANRFSLEVGEKCAIRVGCVSLAPPLTTRPGTFSRATRLSPVPPSARASGPAEKPAAREPGGAGTSVVFAGFSPTIASVASALAPGTGATAGGSAEIS